MIRNRLLISSLFFASVSFFSQSAWSCSCEPPSPPAVALEQADVVFAGTVTNIETREVEKEGPLFFVSFDIISSWKGVEEDKVTIVTMMDSAQCGYPFEMGKEYLVYGDVDNVFTYETGLPATSICSRTQLAEEAQDEMAVLNQETSVEQSCWGQIKMILSYHLIGQNE